LPDGKEHQRKKNLKTVDEAAESCTIDGESPVVKKKDKQLSYPE
jgi:hypothetical protein